LSAEMKKKLRNIAEGIRCVVRGMQGLPIEEDAFSGLLDVKDIRERTRVDIQNIFSHSYMRLLANYGGDEWGIMEDVAEMEDHYFIAEDGEQRKEAILMTKAKTEVRLPDQPISIQKVETKPSEKTEKKGFLRRGKKQD